MDQAISRLQHKVVMGRVQGVCLVGVNQSSSSLQPQEKRERNWLWKKWVVPGQKGIWTRRYGSASWWNQHTTTFLTHKTYHSCLGMMKGFLYALETGSLAHHVFMWCCFGTGLREMAAQPGPAKACGSPICWQVGDPTWLGFQNNRHKSAENKILQLTQCALEEVWQARITAG